MSVTFRSYSTCPAWWDEMIEKNNGEFTSTSLWAKFHEKLYKGKSTYLEVLENSEQILLFLLIDIPLGATILPSQLTSLLSSIPRMRSFTFHLQPTIIRQDFLSDEKALLEVSKKTIQYLYTICKKENKNIVPADFICFKDLKNAIKLKNTFRDTTELIGTTRLLLNKEESVMYQTLDESAKSGIRKCLKMNVKVRKLSSKNIHLFYEGLKSGWGMYKLTVNPEIFFTALGSMYPQHVKYFVATYKNKIVSGSGIMIFGKTMIEFSMYVTPYGKENRIPGGDLIKWEIIKYGIANRIEMLDLNMIAVTQNGHLDEKIKNINFYKLKWGGEISYGITFNKLPPILMQLQKAKHRLLGH